MGKLFKPYVRPHKWYSKRESFFHKKKKRHSFMVFTSSSIIERRSYLLFVKKKMTKTQKCLSDKDIKQSCAVNTTYIKSPRLFCLI